MFFGEEKASIRKKSYNARKEKNLFEGIHSIFAPLFDLFFI